MTSSHSENVSKARPIGFAIPYEIRHHPKLDQATKFTWVYIWELANFRPDTIITSYVRLAADLGKSEKSARRWIQCLAEAGLIEMIDAARRGECVFYVNAPVDWEGDTPPPFGSQVVRQIGSRFAGFRRRLRQIGSRFANFPHFRRKK